jgi:hypothetical protein
MQTIEYAQFRRSCSACRRLVWLPASDGVQTCASITTFV